MLWRLRNFSSHPFDALKFVCFSCAISRAFSCSIGPDTGRFLERAATNHSQTSWSSSSLPFVFILFVSGLTFTSARHSNSRFLFTTLLTAPTDMPNLAAVNRWLEFSAAFRTSNFSDRVKFLLLWRDMVGVSPAESIHELNTTFSVKVI